MKWLRVAAAIYAAAFIFGAVLVFTSGRSAAVALYLVANGLIVSLAIIFERGRYQPKVGEGKWETTGEKFQDPTTGKWMAVRYNRETGERDYIEI